MSAMTEETAIRLAEALERAVNTIEPLVGVLKHSDQVQRAKAENERMREAGLKQLEKYYSTDGDGL